MRFEHSTQAQNLAALRVRFREARGVEAARIAKWIYNNLTVAQVKNLFNLTDAQVTVLRNKMLALRDHLNAVDAGVGE